MGPHQTRQCDAGLRNEVAARCALDARTVRAARPELATLMPGRRAVQEALLRADVGYGKDRQPTMSPAHAAAALAGRTMSVFVFANTDSNEES